MEEFGDVLGERGAAGDREAQAPAESLVELGEHERVREPVLEPEEGRDRLARLLQTRHAATHSDRPVEDLPLERRARFRPREHSRVDLLEHAGHAADEVRLHLGQVLPQLVDALRERGGESPVHPDERLESAEGVGQGQEQQMGVAVLDARHLGRGLQRGHVVAVGLHHALRGAGGARGVDDGGDVRGAHRSHPGLQLAAKALAVLAPEAAKGVPGDRPVRGRARIALHDHDLLEPLHLALHLEHLGELGRVLDEEGLHLRVVDDVLDEVGRVGRIDRDRAAAHREDREVGLHPLRAARREDPHRLVLAAAQREQPGGQLAHDLAGLPPRARAPDAALLGLLGRPVAVRLHPLPEHARQGHVRHAVLLTRVRGAPSAGSCRSGSWAARPRSGSAWGT